MMTVETDHVNSEPIYSALAHCLDTMLSTVSIVSIYFSQSQKVDTILPCTPTPRPNFTYVETKLLRK